MTVLAPRGQTARAPDVDARAERPEGGRPTGSRTLGSAFDPRSNSLDVLRLVLATTVAVAHAGAIGFGRQPVIGGTELGELAVDAFFVLSGFLVTRSLLQLGSVGRYAWHRFLRIMPGFWVCLLLTAGLVAPAVAALEGGAPGAVLGQSWGYVTQNGLLFMRDFSVAGLPTGTHQPHVINGALWTLFYEAVCYVGVAVLGVLGLLRRRRALVVAGVVAVWLVVAGQEAGLVPLVGELFWRFFLMFGLGVLGYLYRDRLSVHGRWVLLAVAGLALALWLEPGYRAVGGGVAFAYLCLVAVVRTPWLRHRLRVDLSYGMYVYHWPLETLLATAGATALTQAGFTVAAVGLAGLVALASWYLVEEPALSHKGFTPSRPRRAGR